MKLILGDGENSGKSKATLKLIEGYKHMIKLNYMIFRNEPFKGAMIKVQNADISHDAHYKVKRYMDAFKAQGKILDEGCQAIMKKYAVLDDKGNPVQVEKEVDGKKVKNFDWIDENAANLEFQALYNTEFVIEQNKLFTHDLNNVRATPLEWEALAPFLYDPS